MYELYINFKHKHKMTPHNEINQSGNKKQKQKNYPNFEDVDLKVESISVLVLRKSNREKPRGFVEFITFMRKEYAQIDISCEQSLISVLQTFF